MVMCFVPECRHYSERDRCRFFRFPSKENEKNRWEELISRTDKRPSRYSLVCSCHFVNGIKSNGPTIFMSLEIQEPAAAVKKKRAPTSDDSPNTSEATVPSDSKRPKAPATREEINSPCSSPKSLSSISEILETQLYYFEDEMFMSEEENRPNTLRLGHISRFDITSPPKPPALSIVVQNGKHYIVDNDNVPTSPILSPSKSLQEPSSCIKLLQKPRPNRPLLPKQKQPKQQKPANSASPPEELFSVIDVDTPSSQIPKGVEPPPVAQIKVETPQVAEKPSVLKMNTLPKVPPITNALLEAQLYFLEEDVKKLRAENEYLKARFCYASIADSDELIILYTGLPSAEVFQLLLSYCLRFDFNYYYDWKVEKIKMEDQLLMTLMKLRRNESHLDLRVRFNCSMAMVANIVLTWLHLLHEVLFLGLMRNVPSQTKNRACPPSCFAEFTGCRMVADFAEVRCADSKQKFKNNHLTHTHFKRGRVLKGLVGVAPNGVVTFCSKLYPGSASNEELVKDSGLLDLLREGDVVLSDRGCPVGNVLPPGVVLNNLPFLSDPLRPNQVLPARSVARTKIHFERAICRVRGFAVLDLIPQSLRPYACQVFQVCAALTNLQHPLIKEIESFY